MASSPRGRDCRLRTASFSLRKAAFSWRLTNAARSNRGAVLAMATDAPEAECREALTAADGDLPVALTAMLTGVDAGTAGAALASAGSIRAAVHMLSRPA